MEAAKPTGFLDSSAWKRATNEQRLKHYKEFVVTLSTKRPRSRARAAWTAASRSATTAAR
jgi:hypothetical protein